MNKYHYSKGLSLIEILVIIAIIGIFATLGTQGYQSMVTGSTFGSNKTEFLQYLNDVRHKSFSEKKHHRIQITNDAGKVTIKLYEPIDTSLQWRDIDFVRSCAWQYVGEDIVGCEEAFCNSNINPLLGATLNRVEIKTINTLNINECANSVCSSMKLDDEGIPTTTVNICYLFDGTIALPDIADNKLFLQIESTSDNTAAINTIHKTGYVE